VAVLGLHAERKMRHCVDVRLVRVVLEPNGCDRKHLVAVSTRVSMHMWRCRPMGWLRVVPGLL
jgi:hypothetical protein